MRYLILGPLEVRDGGTEVELRGGQQRKLLTILLLHGGEAVSSDRLIEELWDGKPPETAAKALQGYVSSLRKQLGQETVETVGAGYRLTVAPEDTDSGRFEELLAEARPLERAPAAAKLSEALALWRGPALADFAYDDFARHEIERLDELRLGGVERRIDLELALGRHDDLVPELEALVRAHPLRERFRGQLMVALYRCGRQSEALDAYREARTALRDELGLEPSEELQALQRSILDHDPALAAPPRVDLPGAAGESRPPEGRKLRRPLLAVALGLAILGAAAAAIALTRTDKAAAIIVPPNSVARVDAAGTKVESYVGVGRGPRAIAVGLGSVWVANGEDGTVDRLDPATGSFQGQSHPIGIGGDDLSGIAIGSHAVWVADGNPGTVTRIDPNLDQVVATIPHDPQQAVAPDPVFYVAYGSHYVWATQANELLRIDPHTNQVDKRLVIGTPTGLATGGGSVWVTTQSGLRRIDPVRVKGITHRSFGFAHAPVYARGSVWLMADNELQQIDPITLAPRDVKPAGSEPASLAAGGGALWVADFFNGKLTRLAADGGRTASLRVGKNLQADKNGPPGASNLSAVAVGGGATWVAVSVGHHVFNFVRQPQPRMLPLLPDRPRRRREGRIRERSHGDGHDSGHRVDGVEDCRAAIGAEVEGGAALSLVREADVLPRGALGRYLFCTESRLGAEDTSRPALAGETVADRDSGRLSLDGEPELLTTTGGVSSAHDQELATGRVLIWPWSSMLTTISSGPRRRMVEPGV